VSGWSGCDRGARPRRRAERPGGGAWHAIRACASRLAGDQRGKEQERLLKKRRAAGRASDADSEQQRCWGWGCCCRTRRGLLCCWARGGWRSHGVPALDTIQPAAGDEELEEMDAPEVHKTFEEALPKVSGGCCCLCSGSRQLCCPWPSLPCCRTDPARTGACLLAQVRKEFKKPALYAGHGNGKRPRAGKGEPATTVLQCTALQPACRPCGTNQSMHQCCRHTAGRGAQHLRHLHHRSRPSPGVQVAWRSARRMCCGRCASRRRRSGWAGARSRGRLPGSR